MFWHAGFARFHDALWRSLGECVLVGKPSLLQTLRRSRVGHDCDNLSMAYEGRSYVVRRNGPQGYNTKFDGTGAYQHVLFRGNYHDAVNFMVRLEMPLRLAHFSRAQQFSTRCSRKLLFSPASLFELHGAVPTAARARASECLERSVLDPESDYYLGPECGKEARRGRRRSRYTSLTTHPSVSS